MREPAHLLLDGWVRPRKKGAETGFVLRSRNGSIPERGSRPLGRFSRRSEHALLSQAAPRYTPARASGWSRFPA